MQPNYQTNKDLPIVIDVFKRRSSLIKKVIEMTEGNLCMFFFYLLSQINIFLH